MIVESLAIGVLASLIGIAAGIGLARGLSGALRRTGPRRCRRARRSTRPGPSWSRSCSASLVTLFAGLWPAVRATRVPPIAAVREGAVLERRKRLGPIAGAVLFGIATALIAYATLGGNLGAGKSLLALAAGTLIGLLGVAGFAPALVSGLAKLVGFPARSLGGPAGQLASSNAVRNPARTASTAAALMIGLALVSFVAVLGKGLARLGRQGAARAGQRGLGDQLQERLVGLHGGGGRRGRDDARNHPLDEHPLRSRPRQECERDGQRRRPENGLRALQLHLEAGLVERQPRKARRDRRSGEALVRERARPAPGRRVHAEDTRREADAPERGRRLPAAEAVRAPGRDRRFPAGVRPQLRPAAATS